MSVRLRPAPHPRLRALRESKGLTRQKVAHALGLSERTVIRHEDGTTPLRRLHVLAYAEFFGVKPEEVEPS
jgi:DNA-binding XRE family transcriptional regulator